MYIFVVDEEKQGEEDDNPQKQDSNQSQKRLYRKQHYQYKSWIVFCSIWISISAFYCFDQPAALYLIIREHFEDHVDNLMFHLYFAAIYTFYTLANFFLPFVTGGLRDCNEDRTIFIFLGFLMMLGQLIFSFGVYTHSIFIMIIGRLTLGWGVEALLPIQSCFISQYYREQHMSTILGVIQFFCFLGLLGSMYYSPIIVQQYGLFLCLLSGVVLIMIGMILLCISIWLDYTVEKQIATNYEFGFVTLSQQSDLIMLQQNYRVEPFYLCKFNDLEVYPKMYWLILIYHTLFYSSILTLINVNINLLVELLFMTMEADEVRLDWTLAQYWTLGCFSIIFFGIIIDHYGKRGLSAILAAILLIFGHLVFFSHNQAGLFILGLAFSLQFVSLWSGIIYIIKPKALGILIFTIQLSQLGKALGLIISFQHLGFSLVPILVAILRIYSGVEESGNLLLPFLGLWALFVSFFIYMENDKLSKQRIQCYEILNSMLDRSYIAMRPFETPAIKDEYMQRKSEHESKSSIMEEDLFINNIKEKARNIE